MRSWANEPMHIIMMILGNTHIIYYNYIYIYICNIGECNRDSHYVLQWLLHVLKYEIACVRLLQYAVLNGSVEEFTLGHFTTYCTETSRCMGYGMLWC